MGIKPEFNKIIRRATLANIIIAAALPLIGVRVNLNPGELKLAVFLGVCIIAGVFIFFAGWDIYGKKRTIENIPTSKIRSIPMGIVEIKGAAKEKYALQTRLNRINCVFYKYLIQSHVTDGYGKNRKNYWKTVSQGSSITPFLVEDSTGSVIVEPFDCDAVLKRRYYYSEGVFNGAKRYSEWYIVPQEELYILGFAGKSADVMSGRKEKLRKRLNELKKPGKEQERYDLNKDGQLDAYEWTLATNAIKREIERDESVSDLCDVAISGRENNRMIISDKSEKELLKSLGIKVLLGIFGGLFLFVLSLFFIFEKFANIKLY